MTQRAEAAALKTDAPLASTESEQKPVVETVEGAATHESQTPPPLASVQPAN